MDERTDAIFPVMREKLGAIGRNVHVRGTVALASLATDAQLERIFHGFAAPAFFDRTAQEHFPEKMRAPARRMFLFVRRHEARTHDFAVRFGASTLSGA